VKLLERLDAWMFREPEKRSIDKMALWARGDVEEWGIHAGVSVNQSTALALTAVYGCVRILSGAIAGLPADAFRRVDGDRQPVPRPPGWLTTPNPESTWFELAEEIMISLLLDGNAFIIITGRDVLGFPTELWTLNPRTVDVKRPEGGGATFFVWEGDKRLSRFGPTNPGGDVLHIRGLSNSGLRGISPISAAAQAIGLALAGEKYGAKFFGRGQTLSGVIEIPPSSAAMTQEYIDLIRENWEAKHGGTDKAHRPAILTGGAEWKPLSVTPEEAQFLETRKFQVEEIARLFGVPPFMLGDVEKTSSWGTGVEQMSIGFVRYSLMPYIIRIEQALDQLLPRGQFVKLNLRGLLRADSKSEAETLAKGIQNGWINQAEVRSLLDLPPKTGLDKHWMPKNFDTIDNLKKPPAPVPPALVDADTQDGTDGDAA
jgi:HK97 family phage portal protein